VDVVKQPELDAKQNLHFWASNVVSRMCVTQLLLLLLLQFTLARALMDFIYHANIGTADSTIQYHNDETTQRYFLLRVKSIKGLHGFSLQFLN
jgi:hypothetical protein